MFGGVPAKTLVDTPATSISSISKRVPGAHTAAHASWKVIVMGPSSGSVGQRTADFDRIDPSMASRARSFSL